MPVLLSDLREVKIATRKYGMIRLRRLSDGDSLVLSELEVTEPDARNFVVRFLVNQLVAPELSVEEIRAWRKRFLTRLVIIWLQNQGINDWQPMSDMPDFAALKQAILDTQYVSVSHVSDALKALDSITERNMAGNAKSMSDAARMLSISNSAQVIAIAKSISESTRRFDIIQKSVLQMQLPNLAEMMRAPLLNIQADLSTVVQRLNIDLARSISAQFSVINNQAAIHQAALQLSTGVLNQIARSVDQTVLATQVLGSNLQAAINAIHSTVPLILPGDLFRALPYFDELFAEWIASRREVREGTDALDKTGFGFTTHLWTYSFVAGFANLAPKTRPAIITNSVTAYTRSEAFREELSETFAGSAFLSRRWHIISTSLEAHQDRDYEISIPALLAQVEGVIGDILILKGLARSRGRKLFARNLDGTLKLNKNQKPHELRGLSELIDHSDFKNYEVLQATVQVIKNQIAPERNAVLHGREVHYDHAKLSTQALLLLLVIASEMASYEQANHV